VGTSTGWNCCTERDSGRCSVSAGSSKRYRRSSSDLAASSFLRRSGVPADCGQPCSGGQPGGGTQSGGCGYASAAADHDERHRPSAVGESN
jgi:hypothetical protein